MISVACGLGELSLATSVSEWVRQVLESFLRRRLGRHKVQKFFLQLSFVHLVMAHGGFPQTQWEIRQSRAHLFPQLKDHLG